MTAQEVLVVTCLCGLDTYIQPLLLGVEVIRTVEGVLSLLCFYAGLHDPVTCLEDLPASFALDLDAKVAVCLQAPLRQHQLLQSRICRLLLTLFNKNPVEYL